MKKLLLWLVMVVVMLAVLLGGAGYAMYAMTGDDKPSPALAPILGRYGTGTDRLMTGSGRRAGHLMC